MNILFHILSFSAPLFAVPTPPAQITAVAPGFAGGMDYAAVVIQGEVSVVCHGSQGSTNLAYVCRDVVLDPAAYDYFIGPQDGRADSVELVATHQDGSKRAKTSSYDGSVGKSKDAFNLWISTLFQKRLFELGVNSIHYKLYSSKVTGSVFAEGDFQAEVKRGTARQCSPRSYDSVSPSDCSSPYTMCQRYFEDLRNCR